MPAFPTIRTLSTESKQLNTIRRDGKNVIVVIVVGGCLRGENDSGGMGEARAGDTRETK